MSDSPVNLTGLKGRTTKCTLSVMNYNWNDALEGTYSLKNSLVLWTKDNY